MENSFRSIIDQSKSILILLPTKPFLDQVAAGLSLHLCLREEKNIQISSSSPVTVEFNRLIGVNKVSSELGNKNLIIRFSNYKASDIEKVSYDIENGQFRLTVIPKQRIKPPAKEQIELSYSGVSADTVVIIGGANESHFPAITSKDLAGANLVHIGTKDISLSSNKNYISFSRPASSVSEIIYSLIKESGFILDQDIATNLLMGIEDASDNFRRGATAETFAAVSDLMMVGEKRWPKRFLPKLTYPAGTIPGQLIKQQAVQAKKTMEVPQYKFTKQGTSSQKLDQKDNEEKVD